MGKLVFLGTSDAFNGAGRANSCYWVEDDLGRYAVDFGPTAPMKCAQLGLDPAGLDGVYLTHLHGDHIGGISILLMHLHFVAKRTRPFVIAGPSGMRARLEKLWESAYPSVFHKGLSFPIEFIVWPVPGQLEVLGRKVTTLRAQHDSFATAASIRIKSDTIDLAFSGDTGWQESLGTFVNESDLFICECSNVTADYWGHLSVEELLAHRTEINVGQLYLSHLSDASRSAAEKESDDLKAIIADDGMVIQWPS